MQHNPDPAIVAAAVVCRVRYEEAATAVRQHAEGFHHLPGTVYYNVVLAWRGACHALAASDERDAG